MGSYKEEKKLLRLTYLLCIVCFANLAFIEEEPNFGSLAIGLIICILIGYSYFIIRRYFIKGDKYLLLFCNVLAVIGIVMLYRLDKSLAIKQVLWFVLGICCFIFVVVMLPELKKFNKYRYLYLAATIVFMAMATFFGTTIGGAKNWVMIGGIGFQPSEFGKIALVAYLASALQNYGSKEKVDESLLEKFLNKKFPNLKLSDNIRTLIEPAVVVMISLGFMVLQRDLGSALLLFSVSITMLYLSTSNAKYVFICLALFIFGAVVSYFLFSHVRVRVQIWQDPWQYAHTQGFQLVQSLIAIVSGGFFGRGLGMGQPSIIPVVESDFIFAAICEEMGIVMGIAILLLYFLLFYRTMRAALRANNNFSRIVAVGLSTMIATQVLVIVGGVIGAIPLTGITLPLVSNGGSSMIITFFSLGILQKISEEGK
ncbi:cell division protein FtsW, lipid II flippase [Clostridium collagenovorans DSM 3089]|uniref:Cell division protein FtsW, lipid II flippase n=1 Tax=Clostridium collagenovorans DSM 3089 TaxID=1121306 RepID=A0A1M5WXN1_9CLOT|nr:FtsW/RodA/SpoVE family cell cycle protein [Clostridium collagenovorans]SHH92426.1 cell division protein FtsW, lipid II flippase [Clostridium collagenovorans DSM 3089]